jgi:hypothetical protein
LDFDNQQIVILSGGKGFVEEPVLHVLGLESNESESNTTILTLDPSWIRVPAGTDANVSAILRDFNQSAPRGLRGMTIDASQYVPQTSSELGSSLGAYWLSYRRNVSEFGLSVILGTAETSPVPDETDNNTPYLDYLLDMTLHTPDDFTDAYLLPGFTFSDYEADVHVTPLSKGGIYPMEYLNVVVNTGTVAAGNATAPTFALDVSTQTPSIGEYVAINARVTDGNVSDYAYSWFVNEIPVTDSSFLNQPTLNKTFENVGEYVVRSVVSDMKGGIASKNMIFRVGDYYNYGKSMISGTVRSGKGVLQGARVVIEPATVIEHNVSMTGSPVGSYLPSGTNAPLRYLIDGMEAPDLVP